VIYDRDDQVRAAERAFGRRASDREAYFIDARPEITSEAFDRDNARAWKFCKTVMGCIVFFAFVYAVFYWFGGIR
jgi:hypothetical protein